jgi:hypothetical protein
MPEIVDWLLDRPERWVPFAFVLASVLFGVPALVREWRRRDVEDRERRRQVLSPWLGLSTAEQAEQDRKALDAYTEASKHAAEAAERIVRDAAERMAHLYD